MEFGQEDVKDQYSDNKEEDQEEDDVVDHNQVRNASTRLPLMSFCAPSSSSSKKWPQMSTGNNNNQLMDYLSLKTGAGENGGGGGEREHMFDKVVTPSDVGKLNRLVIPKQHAEKFFPLDSSANEKGLLLNFEDRAGKSWRFRYSYWNSSQSYVMTKGWSRFVKEKKLDAGDIVSFQREPPSGRLFIDWRRRPHHHHHLLANPAASLFPIDHPYHYHYHYHQPRWGAGAGAGILHSLPLTMAPPATHENYLQHGHSSSVIHYPSYHDHYQHHYHQVPVLMNSTPAASPAAAGPSKRLRLFGVNMEYCPNDQEGDQAPLDRHDDDLTPFSSSSVQYPLQVRIPTHSSPILPLPRPTTTFPGEFSQFKGKSANNSLSFDLDF